MISISRKFIALVLLLQQPSVGAGIGSVQQGPQEEMLPEEAQQQQWTKAYQDAENCFQIRESNRQHSAVSGSCIAKITEQRLKRQLSEPEQLLLYRSLDHLALAFFFDGQKRSIRPGVL